jgi:hypothetical protein
METIHSLSKLRKDIKESLEVGDEEKAHQANVGDSVVEIQLWKIYLELYEDQVPSPIELQPFENDKHQVRLMIEGAYMAAQSIFEAIKSQYTGLTNVKLELDKENLCLIMCDEMFDYRFPKKISFRLEKELCL